MTLVASKSRQKQLAGKKRDAAIRAKQRKEVDAIIARKDAERTAAIAARKISDAQLGGLGKNLTTREVLEVQAALEADERELRRWQKRMTEGPETVAHSGIRHAAHRS